MPDAIQLDTRDNVATLVHDLSTRGQAIRLSDDAPPAAHAHGPVPFGHKVALQAIARGAAVIKYGQVIGHASHDIAAGEHVHSHNLESDRARGDRPAGEAAATEAA